MCSCKASVHAELQAKYDGWVPEAGDPIRLSIGSKTAEEMYPGKVYHFQVGPFNKGRLQNVLDADGKPAPCFLSLAHGPYKKKEDERPTVEPDPLEECKNAGGLVCEKDQAKVGSFTGQGCEKIGGQIFMAKHFEKRRKWNWCEENRV